MSELTEEAMKSIAAAAAEARRAIASEAADAMKVVVANSHQQNNPFPSADHDLLVKLNTRMEDLTLAVSKLASKDETLNHAADDMKRHAEDDKQHADHEARLRLVEQNMWKWLGVSSIGGAIISIGMAFALKLIK